MGPRLDNEHRERGENARNRGDSHRHVESREQLRTALLQDAAEKQGDGEEGPGARDRAVDARRGSDDAVAAFNPLCACPIPNASRLAPQAR